MKRLMLAGAAAVLALNGAAATRVKSLWVPQRPLPVPSRSWW